MKRKTRTCALGNKACRDDRSVLYYRVPLRPALNRALVDAWSMTSLETHIGRPDVATWLRGWVDETPQTTVVWRTHLPVRVDDRRHPMLPSKTEIEDFFEAAPLHESEKLETETYRVVSWLQDWRQCAAQAQATCSGRRRHPPRRLFPAGDGSGPPATPALSFAPPEWLPADTLDDAYFRLLPSGQSTVTAEEAALLAAVFSDELRARPAGVRHGEGVGRLDVAHRGVELLVAGVQRDRGDRRTLRGRTRDESAAQRVAREQRRIESDCSAAPLDHA
jgi:hypothetical protein